MRRNCGAPLRFRPALRRCWLPLAAVAAGLLGLPTNRYRRPYEGTDAPAAAMQAYLDWEYGLVAQLGRDATHGFRVLMADAVAAGGAAPG